MKNIFGIVLVVVLLLSAAVFAMPVGAAGISDHLVAHWDFVGNDLDTQLSDKAPAGKSSDKLIVAGNVTIQNGVATVPSTAGSYLYALNQDDLNSFTEFTAFVKLKASGTPTGFADFISKDGAYLFRGFINNNNCTETEYGLDCRLKGQFGLSWVFANGGLFPKTGDLYIALTAALDTTKGKVTLVSYYSTDGVNYHASIAKELDLTDSVLGTTSDYSANPLTGALVLGKHAGSNRDKDMGVTFALDDVRIYNKALTENEVKSIQVSNTVEQTTTATTTTAASTTANTTSPTTADMAVWAPLACVLAALAVVITRKRCRIG